MFGVARGGGWFGGSLFARSGIGDDATSWTYTFWIFQTVFAATAATIVSRAMAERTRLVGYLCYSTGLTYQHNRKELRYKTMDAPQPQRRRKTGWKLSLVASLMAAASPALAQGGATAINHGDTAWVLVSAALVFLMTPGLAFFYVLLVRSKNVLGTMMHCLAAMGIGSVVWVVAGYTLAFGTDAGGVIGGLEYLFLNKVGMAPTEGSTIPHLAFSSFQGMFAIITPALIAGAVAERMKFSAFFWFITAWVMLVYAPLAHWVWGGGWLMEMGALDFAGGTVVHISSGISALVACLVIGRRRGFPREPILPHNLTYVILGGGLLWFGWFGFNAGSALAANGLAANALVTTNTSAAAGALGWLLYDWLKFGKPTALGTVSGAVAGLVGITPAAGFVAPWAALAIGVLAGLGCATFVGWRTRRGIDDSLDAFGVHGIGGTIGAILTGVFALEAIGGTKGLIEGNIGIMGIQVIGVVATYVYAAVVSLVILLVLRSVTGLRIGEDDEMIGLDQTQHGETGYSL